MTLLARLASVALNVVNPPPLARSAFSPASSTASPSLPALPSACDIDAPIPSADPDAPAIFVSSSLISLEVLLMSAFALFICVRSLDMAISLAFTADDDLSTSCARPATTFDCALYSGEVLPSVASICASFCFSASYDATSVLCLVLFSAYCAFMARYCAVRTFSFSFCTDSLLFSTCVCSVNAACESSLLAYCELTTFICDPTSRRFCEIRVNA